MSSERYRAEKGLAGVIVAATAISDVQPSGCLSYRGHGLTSW